AADYQRAITLLEKARGESLTRDEKILTYRTLGMAYVAVGQPGPAKVDFEHLLRVEPSAELDRSVAPKVRAVFEEAKAEAATSAHALAPALPTVAPSIEPTAPREGRPVDVHVVYRGGVARKMTVFFRKAGDAQFSRATVDGAAGTFDATVPGLAVQPPSLEYHVVLLDDAGASVAEAGSLGQPLSVGVARASKPVYKRGWFWGVLGGVAAAGAIATGLALGLPRSSSAPVTVNPQ
ncbi:MAG TPA: hypothetical protein VF334_09980, partial [Polyangia bacterium]